MKNALFCGRLFLSYSIQVKHIKTTKYKKKSDIYDLVC